MRAIFSWVMGLVLSAGAFAAVIWYAAAREDAILVLAGVLAGLSTAWAVGGLFDSLLGRRR